MARKNKRYQETIKNLTILLIASMVVFILYLLVACYGILWLKAITSIFALLLSGLCLFYLYLIRSFFQNRGFWLSVGFFAILLFTVLSLLTGFPKPGVI